MTSSSSSHWSATARRFMRNRVSVAALLYLLLVLVVAVAAPWVSRHDPLLQDLGSRLSEPSGAHWLGTDDLGRDTFARLVYGTRTSILTTLSVGAFGTLIAVPIGLASGYWSGRLDVVVMRVTDALLSIPPLVLALAVAGILGPGSRNLIISLVVVIIPGLVRLTRASTLAIREEGYVDASKAIGTRPLSIIRRRVFPHVLSPLLVQIAVIMGTILVVEASLSFLGLGDPPPNASWGSMLYSGFQLMATDMRLLMVPAIAIAITTFAFNAVGDGLRDAMQASSGQRRKRGDVLGTTSTASRPATGFAPGALVHPEESNALAIRGLSVGFDTADGVVQVLDGVDLEVRRGEILGLVGESGCGKTVTSMSVLRLLPSPPARILCGQVMFEGRDLLGLSPRELRAVRGNEIAMVFQDPMATLNPAFTIGHQIVEAHRIHSDVSKAAAKARATELLDLVGIPNPAKRLDDYPHMFSGGMRQRVLIAMALVNSPKLLIADEPTTALDVTVQAQILELIRDLRDEFDMSVLFVTHDFGIVQDLCDRVTVMYAGQVVETASVDDLLTAPRHPYSAALLRSRPRLGDERERLSSIPGLVPSPKAMPVGCRFHSRCTYAVDECAKGPIALEAIELQRAVRCCRHAELELAELEDRLRFDIRVDERAVEVGST